jgi:hypothetical protein
MSRRSMPSLARALQAPWRCRHGGFSLVELLLALAFGLVFTTLMLQVLLAEGSNGERLARLVRERTLQRRTLELLRTDLLLAGSLGSDGLSDPAAPVADGVACPLVGRRAVLRFNTLQGPVLYAQGPAPSSIWRGQVLMRCGPAYGLQGEPSGGKPLNRVLIDALAPEGLEATPLSAGRLRLRLRQQFPRPGGVQTISSEMEVAARL